MLQLKILEKAVAICSNMNGPKNITHSEKSQRQILCDITYMWNLKNNTNVYAKQKQNQI